MVKLLICLLSGLLIAIAQLQLRQQRLDLNYQANQLHNQIEARQAKLWNQQMQISLYTAPNAIAHTVGVLPVKLVPQGQGPQKSPDWIHASANPDAE